MSLGGAVNDVHVKSEALKIENWEFDKASTCRMYVERKVSIQWRNNGGSKEA